MENQLINIDSQFRDTNAFTNAGKFRFKLNDTIKNISYVRLSSIEFPNIYYNYTRQKDNISFGITIDGITHLITILEGSYTVDLMLTLIQSLFDNLNSNTGNTYNFQIKFNQITSKVTLLNNANFSINFINSGQYHSLGYSLGFRNNIYTDAMSYTASSILNVSGDNYIYIKVNDYGVFRTNNNNGTINILAKIILGGNKTSIIFDNESNFLSKNYIFKQPVNMLTFDIELLDYNGNTLDMQGQDFSFTLEVGNIYNAHLYSKLLTNIF